MAKHRTITSFFPLRPPPSSHPSKLAHDPLPTPRTLPLEPHSNSILVPLHSTSPTRSCAQCSINPVVPDAPPPPSPKQAPAQPLVRPLSPTPLRTLPPNAANLIESRVKPRPPSRRTGVDAAWPQPGHTHNRQSYTSNAPLPEFCTRPKPQKGKRPMRPCAHGFGTADPPFWVPPSHQADPEPSITLLPALARLDLAPPSSLIPELASDPVYRHPLIARFVRLLDASPSQPITYDHPSLRRQHHRSPDTAAQLWTHKYGPMAAREVLGDQNAYSAHVLKCWLKQVAVRYSDEHQQDLVPPSTLSHHQLAKPNDRRRPPKNHAQKKLISLPSKKRTIIRKVDPKPLKKRRTAGYASSDDLEDFIVEDDDENIIYSKDIQPHLLESTSSEPDSPVRAQSHRKRFESAFSAAPQLLGASVDEEEEPKVEFEQLTNLMLLQGPNGCGKTSTVYAVAAELGWDVFEINPGVLRTRKEINRLVGDVARNHVLPGSSNNHKPESHLEDAPAHQKKPVKASGPVNPFFAMMKSAQEKLNSEQLSKSAPVSEAHAQAAPTGSHTRPNRDRRQGARQTLILLDEADIVYGQDKDFWPGVVELVSSSMRPVVMTCNNTALIPLATLPIQQTLTFTHPPPKLSAAWLQVLATLEGHLLDRDELERFYVQHVYRYPLDCPPGPAANALGHPRPSSCHNTVPDLRRTLIQLQFWCQWAVGSRMGGVEWLDLGPDQRTKMLFSARSLPARLVEMDESEMTVNELLLSRDSPSLRQATSSASSLDALCKACESRSFVDAFVDKRPEAQLDIFEYDRSYSKVDDQVMSGMVVLETEQDMLASVNREVERETALWILQRLPLAPFDELDFGDKRSKYLRQIDEATEFLPLTAAMVPHPALVAEYGPWMRNIVEAEDKLEGAHYRAQQLLSVRPGVVMGRARGLRSSSRLNGSISFERRFDIEPDYLELVRQSGFQYNDDENGLKVL